MRRTTTDYDRIRCYVPPFEPDVLAVQEAEGEEALSRVLDADVYDVHVDDRQALPWVDRTSFRHITYRQATRRSGTRYRTIVRCWLSCGSGNETVAGEDDKGC